MLWWSLIVVQGELFHLSSNLVFLEMNHRFESFTEINESLSHLSYNTLAANQISLDFRDLFWF